MLADMLESFRGLCNESVRDPVMNHCFDN